jgi:hypothetical protein
LSKAELLEYILALRGLQLVDELVQQVVDLILAVKQALASGVDQSVQDVLQSLALVDYTVEPLVQCQVVRFVVWHVSPPFGPVYA